METSYYYQNQLLPRYLKSPDFYLGNTSNYISGSGGNLAIYSTGATTLSGSSITLKTPDFYFGDSSNYVSGSGGNLAIYSTGNTTLSGSSVKIKTPDFYFGDSSVFLSGSGGELAIGAENFSVDKDGNLSIGKSTFEHIEIADGSDILFKNNNTIYAEMNAEVWTIGGATDSTDNTLKVSPAGIAIYESSTNYATMSSDGFEIYKGGVSVADFGTISRVGDAANEHISMSTAGMHIKDGSTTRALFTGGGATLGVTSGPHISASTTDIFIKQSANDYLQIDSDSVDIYAGGNLQGTFAATTKIGTTADYLELDSTSIDFMRNTSTSVMNLTDSAFRLGDSSNEHIIVDTGGLTIKDSSTVRGKFTATGAIIGETSKPHISASTLDVSVIKDSNYYLKLDSDSVDIVLDGGTSASFGTTTTIGPSAGSHVAINSSGVTTYFDSNNYSKVDSDSFDIVLDGQTSASFGAYTTIGPPGGKHVAINSDGVKVNVGGNTKASFASDITLTGGTITIRNATNNNDKIVIAEDSF